MRGLCTQLRTAYCWFLEVLQAQGLRLALVTDKLASAQAANRLMPTAAVEERNGYTTTTAIP